MFAAVAIALVCAPPEATPMDEDVSDIDKPKLTTRQAQRLAERPLIEARVRRTATSQPELTLETGATVFIEGRFTVRVPRGARLAARVERRATRGAVSLVPWLSELEISADTATVRPGKKVRRGKKQRKKRGKGPLRNVLAWYGIRVQPDAEPGRSAVRARVEFRDRETWEVVGTGSVEHKVNVVAATPSEADLKLDRKAFLLFQKEAKKSYAKLTQLHHYLRLDRVDPPPDGVKLPPETFQILETFYEDRLKADIARAHLVAAAKGEDPKIAETAILALGSLSRRPEGPAARARIIEGKKPAEAIFIAEKFLRELELDQAEGILNKLRLGKAGELTQSQLAVSLSLLAAVYAARGQPEKAEQRFGQALCLQPTISPPSQRNPMKSTFQKVKANLRCDKPMTAGKPSAERRNSIGGSEIVVSIPFGPDPYALISGGDIVLVGGGGGVLSEQRVRAEHKGSALLEAVFPDTEKIAVLGGRLLVRAVARDVSGVELAAVGFPEPVALSIAAAEDYSEPLFPWWVWVVSGVAVAGAAAATVAIVRGSDEARGIGPISITF